MDNFHSMFPFQQDEDNELLFPQPCTNPINFIYQQDLVNDFAPFNSLELGDNNLAFNNNKNDSNNNNNNQRGNKLRKPSASSLHVEKEKGTNGNKEKKVIHREVERQRRQEMATLYASLRQQLPLENIKGKRSTSDHILEAANYIEHLQKNVKNLEEKRENLKKESSLRNLGYPKSGSSSTSDSSPAIVRVKECLDGMEILVNCGLNNEGFRLSRVLEVLLQEGLSIVNCSCTKTNTTSALHTIRTEATDQPRINVDVIQQKLADIIHGDTSFK
ncbi:transcription factor bHLH118-like [Lycium barbarum]|uniref:transcription factor bHLH118-like n=1 Tax=Lycium barbarum TaxID=112863 RepID=UPI00293EF994|nr:transcription factor bHLH118-like [Lycium barbarum]